MSEREKFTGWCVLELFGHRRLAGLVSEVEIAGGGFLRLDIPEEDGQPAATQFYSPSSVYAITPTTEETVRSFRSRPAPIAEWEIRREAAAALPVGEREYDPDPDGWGTEQA